MCVELVYDSARGAEVLKLKAPYYNAIETSKVSFIQEGISVYADSLGHIEFFDQEDKSLGFVDVPVSKDPSEKGHTSQYGDCECFLEESNVTVKLPIYDWEDRYPHCDGESDRWDRYILRWFRIALNVNTKAIEVLDL